MSQNAIRTSRVEGILANIYAEALDPERVVDETSYGKSLDKLFDTTVWGFREILLVVVVAMNLDESYRASSALYSCNPRSLYEGPIKDFLREKGIPHRKSGPLNIAKATPGLNESWAAQRRPAELANEVVKIVSLLESDAEATGDTIEVFGISLMRRFVAQAKKINHLAVEIDPTSDPEQLSLMCKHLIRETPDAGNTPQKIAAFLLMWYHIGWQTGVTVTGDEDRASVTSTTSKKPGDVNEEKLGEIKVYEITVKPFDIPRIVDSYDTVNTYNLANGTDINEVIVICRKVDCPDEMVDSGLNHYLGYYEYQDMTYYYWDIFEWISSTLQRMTPISRKYFYEALNSYVNEVNTAESVKRLWKKLHKEN